jgi:hypothetical protein
MTAIKLLAPRLAPTSDTISIEWLFRLFELREPALRVHSPVLGRQEAPA